MIESIELFFMGYSPVQQALIAWLFTRWVTGLWASLVFFFKTMNRKFFDIMLWFTWWVMLAASFWSLLSPAIAMSEWWPVPVWFPAAVWFLWWWLLLFSLDKIIPHLHINAKFEDTEWMKTSWWRTTLLVLAITLHNIPEWLAVGVAFGGIAAGIPEATIGWAIALAIGIGIQNFPEWIAVAMPLRRIWESRWKSFWWGQLSAILEPVAAVAGAAMVITMTPILPYALAFAAWAMVYVVIEEVVPESQSDKYTDLATIWLMIWFVVMMILDVALW